MKRNIKTKEQIQEELGDNGDVYTIMEFLDDMIGGCLLPYDGNGYFHDGTQETNKSVWDNDLSLVDLRQYPYVTWYNK